MQSTFFAEVGIWAWKFLRWMAAETKKKMCCCTSIRGLHYCVLLLSHASNLEFSLMSLSFIVGFIFWRDFLGCVIALLIGGGFNKRKGSGHHVSQLKKKKGGGGLWAYI